MRSFFLPFLLTGLWLGLASCASTPAQPVYAFYREGNPSQFVTKAIIRIPSGLGPVIPEGLTVYVDGVKIANVAGGETKEVEVTPGKHLVRVDTKRFVNITKEVYFFKGSLLFIDLRLGGMSYDDEFWWRDTPRPPEAIAVPTTTVP